jgi:hypothetical protein
MGMGIVSIRKFGGLSLFEQKAIKISITADNQCEDTGVAGAKTLPPRPHIPLSPLPQSYLGLRDSGSRSLRSLPGMTDVF